MHQFISNSDPSLTPPFSLHTLHFTLLPFLNQHDNVTHEEPQIASFLVFKPISSKSARYLHVIILTKSNHLIRGALIPTTAHESHSGHSYLLKLEDFVTLESLAPQPHRISSRLSTLLDRTRVSGSSQKNVKIPKLLVQQSHNRLVILHQNTLYCCDLSSPTLQLHRIAGLPDKILMIALNKQNDDELLCLVPHGVVKFIKILPQMPGESQHNCIELRDELTVPYIYYQQPSKMEPIHEMLYFNRFISFKFASGFYVIVDANSGKTLVNSLNHKNDKTHDFSPWPRLLEDGSGLFTHFCKVVGADRYIYQTDEQRKGPDFHQSTCCDYVAPFVINCEPRGVHFYGIYWDEVIYSKMDFKHSVDMCVSENQFFILGRSKHSHSLLIGDPLSCFEHKRRLIMSPRFLFKEALELHNQDFDTKIEETIVAHQSILEEIDTEHNKALTHLALNRDEGKIDEAQYNEQEREIQQQFEKRAKDEKQRNRKNVQNLERIRDCEERQLHVYAGLSLMKRKDFKNAFSRFRRTHIDARYFTPFLTVMNIPVHQVSEESAAIENPVYEQEILSHNVEVDSGYTHLFAESLLSYLYHTQLQYLNEKDSILRHKLIDALYYSNSIELSADAADRLKKLVKQRFEEEIADVEVMISIIEQDIDNLKPLEEKPDMESLMQKLVAIQIENRTLKDNIDSMAEQMSALRQENKLLHQTIKKLAQQRHSRTMSATDLTSQITNDDTRSYHSEDPREELLSVTEELIRSFPLSRNDSDKFLRVPSSPLRNQTVTYDDDEEEDMERTHLLDTTSDGGVHSKTETTTGGNTVRDTDASLDGQEENDDGGILSEDESITELLGKTASFAIHNDSSSEDTNGVLSVNTPLL